MPVSNPAKLSSIKAEFGGPNNLSAYTRGGTYVPMNSPSQIKTTVNGLAISQFNGVSKPPVLTLTNTFWLLGFSIPIGFTQLQAYCEAQIRPDGKVWTGHTFQQIQQGSSWLSGAAGNLLQYRITKADLIQDTYPNTVKITRTPTTTTGWIDYNSYLVVSLTFDRKSTNSSNWWMGFEATNETEIEFRIKSTQQSIGKLKFEIYVGDSV